jgi:3-dehydroquinate synthase
MVGEAQSPGPVLVTHALGSYPVYVEPGALARLPLLIQELLPERRVALIADARVHGLYRSGDWGTAPWDGESLTFEPGEKSKTRESWAELTDQLTERGFGRDAGVVALGGGVTGDLAGFVAATYMRGIPYLQVPTTILAMLDASVGGKTGVDTPLGKNLVGAFHAPAAVIADPRTLQTLPEREYRAGLAEAVKHGLIADSSYLAWIESNVDAIGKRDPVTLVHLVRRSVEIKARVVSDDERESGRRAILNAGHTIAHAVEQSSGYVVPHGEAVALGLVAESYLSETLEIGTPGLSGRVSALLNELGLPVRLPPSISLSRLLDSMSRDKKNKKAQIHFALVAGAGQMQGSEEWTTPVPVRQIKTALAAIEESGAGE